MVVVALAALVAKGRHVKTASVCRCVRQTAQERIVEMMVVVALAALVGHG
jgi:hypothetical protein